MTDSKFLHISVDLTEHKKSIPELKELFNTALDWVNYIPNCWILWTNSEVEVWYKHIRKITGDDSFFIVELKIDNRQGWLPLHVWDWVQKSRN